MTFDDALRLIGLIAVPLGAVVAAYFTRDFDPRRRKHAQTNADLDLLERLRSLDEGPPSVEGSTAAHLQRSIELRVRRASAASEPYTPTERLWRTVAISAGIFAFFVGTALAGSDGRGPLWARLVFGAIIAGAYLTIIFTDMTRGARRREIARLDEPVRQPAVSPESRWHGLSALVLLAMVLYRICRR